MTGVELLDPAGADNFRMTKDFGRWYHDPLPGCDIAAATEDQWPSCSAVKKASEKDWSFLVAPRLAALEPDEYRRLATLDQTQRLDAFKSAEKYAKNIAFGRGSIVHLWKEDLLAGRAPREISAGWLTANKYPSQAVEEAKVYLPAIRDFFDVYQPEPVVVEYVTIHRTLNGHGYGATPDALVRIEGEVVAVDWKTRSDGSNHAAYAEELAQVTCGVRAEYMIVRDGGDARRARLPEVSGAYVVSIKTDGARLYPLDIDKGWEHWCRLHEWWVARLTEKDGVGRVLPARRKAKPPAADDRRKALLARYEALTHDQKAEFKARRTKGDLDAVEHALDDIEHPPTIRQAQAKVRDAGKSNRTEQTPKPDEGPDVEPTDFEPLGAAYVNLPEPAQLWCARLLGEAKNAGVPIHRTNAPTLRRYEIYRGLIRLAATGDDLDAILIGLVHAANDNTPDNITPGHALGMLNADQAAAFSKLVDQLVDEVA